MTFTFFISSQHLYSLPTQIIIIIPWIPFPVGVISDHKGQSGTEIISVGLSYREPGHQLHRRLRQRGIVFAVIHCILTRLRLSHSSFRVSGRHTICVEERFRVLELLE